MDDPGLLRCRSMRGEKFWVKIPLDASNHRNLGRDFLDCQESKTTLVQTRPRRHASSARGPKHLPFGAPSWSGRRRGAINQIEIRQHDWVSASMSQARAVVISDGRSFVRSIERNERACREPGGRLVLRGVATPPSRAWSGAPKAAVNVLRIQPTIGLYRLCRPRLEMYVQTPQCHNTTTQRY